MFSDISYIIYFHIGTEIFEFKLYQFSNIWLNLFSLFAKVRPLFESSQTTTKMLLVHLKRVQSWAGLNGLKLQIPNYNSNCSPKVNLFDRTTKKLRKRCLLFRARFHAKKGVLSVRSIVASCHVKEQVVLLWHFISLFLSFFVDFKTICFVSSKLFLFFCSLSTNFEVFHINTASNK